MTMHMLPAYYTTTNTKKRKAKKKTKSQIEADKQHEKFLKKHGVGLFGKKVQRSVAQPGSASGLGPGGRKFESYRSDQSKDIPSHEFTGYDKSMAKKDQNIYSGERKLLGIATMHKSNLVPVFDEDDAKEIARMRR